MHRPTTRLVGFLSVVALLASAGCDVLDMVPLSSTSKTISEVFKTGNAPRVVVDTFNGQIDVSPGDDDEVVVEVVKRAGGINEEAAEALLETIEVTMIQKDNTLTITAQRVGPRVGNTGASVAIAVPAGADVQLKSSNGKIVCEGLQGKLEASTSNGKLEVVEGHGPMKIATSNGSIAIEATGAKIDARTSNGPVTFRGSLADGDHKFKSSNGRITLSLPETSQFHLDGATSNGRVNCDFQLDGPKRKRRSRLEGDVGKPTFSIDAHTSNGSIDIRRASTDKG